MKKFVTGVDFPPAYPRACWGPTAPLPPVGPITLTPTRPLMSDPLTVAWLTAIPSPWRYGGDIMVAVCLVAKG